MALLRPRHLVQATNLVAANSTNMSNCSEEALYSRISSGEEENLEVTKIYQHEDCKAKVSRRTVKRKLQKVCLKESRSTALVR